MAETDRSISTEEAKGIDIDELLKRLSADKKGLSTSVAINAEIIKSAPYP